ncbi:MAG: hypothetical protein HQM08_20165 [Candidatus Riflebacteria bacterium]|nr:hypothetical protein [Candidatus Riflebacteria bacterium]
MEIKTNKVYSAIIAFFALAMLLFGGFYFSGRQKNNEFCRLVDEGASFFQNEKLDQAIDSFGKAVSLNTSSRRFFVSIQKMFGKKYPDPKEVVLMRSEVFLSKAYDELFLLKPAESYLEKAKNGIYNINTPEAEELKNSLITALGVSRLCQTIVKRNFQKVLKDLLEVEKKASATDKDFFIMEIRLLIICGKSLKNQELLQQARELLWIITSKSSTRDRRTDTLWTLLSR